MLTVVEAPGFVPTKAMTAEQIAELSLAILKLATDSAAVPAAGFTGWIPAASVATAPAVEEPTWEDAAWQ